MNPLAGIAMKILSVFFLTMSAALVKASAAHYPVGQVIFLRSGLGLAPIMLWLAWRGQLSASVRTRRFGRHFRRGLLGFGATYLTFLALAYLPLPDATAIGYIAPLVLVVLAGLVLKERIAPYRWVAVAAGFCGILVMLSPHLSAGILGRGVDAESGTGVLVALAAALSLAVAMMTTSQLTQTETTGAIVFYFFLLVTLMSLVTAPFGWVMPSMQQVPMLLAMALLGSVGQILLTECYRHADTSVVAGFEYTSMVWAVVLGWSMFGDLPSIVVIAGALIVAGAGLFMTLREHRARRRLKTLQ